MSRLTRDGTAEPVSRDQILRRERTKFSGANERGQGNIHFPCSADHEQDWQPYLVDPYSCYIFFALLYWCSLSQRLTVRCPPPSDWWGVLSDSRTVSTVRVVLTLGLPCLLIYLSLGYAWRVFAFVFLLLFYFFPSPPIRSGEVFSSVIFFLSFSSFVCVFWM